MLVTCCDMVWEVIGLVDRRRRSQADDGVMRFFRQDTAAHQFFYHMTGAGMNRIDPDSGGSTLTRGLPPIWLKWGASPAETIPPPKNFRRHRPLSEGYHPGMDRRFRTGYVCANF